MGQFLYSVNTNGLRNNYSNGEIVAMCKKLKVQGIEWGLPSLDKARRAIKDMHKRTRDAGLRVAGYINGGKLWKKDELKRWVDIVASVDGPSLRVAHPWVAFSYEESLHQRVSYNDIFRMAQDAMPAVAELSRASGVRLLLEMHSGSLVASTLAAVMLFDGIDPKYVGAIYDPANTVMEGNLRPRSEVEVLGRYMGYVHAKNITFTLAGRFKEKPVQRANWKYMKTHLPYGMVDWVEIFFALKVGGFKGWISSEEYFSDGTDQYEQLRSGIAFLKECARAAPARPRKPYTRFND